MKKTILSLLSLSLLTMSTLTISSQAKADTAGEILTRQARLESLTEQKAILDAILPDALRVGNANVPHKFTYSIMATGNTIMITGAGGAVLGVIGFLTSKFIDSAEKQGRETLNTRSGQLGWVGVALVAVGAAADLTCLAVGDEQFIITYDNESSAKIQSKIATLKGEIAGERAIVAILKARGQ